MTRLINIEDAALLKTVADGGLSAKALWRRINAQPTIDAVPVIRCCECKFVGTDATCCLVCKREGMGLRPFHVYHDDYCSYAERKEENGK